MYTITFRFEETGLRTVRLKNIEPGYSLLEIALNNRIELDHDCGGICSCSTCHLFLEKGAEFVAEMNKREKDLIERVVNRRADSRLACQCLLINGGGNVEVTVPVQALGKHEHRDGPC